MELLIVPLLLWMVYEDFLWRQVLLWHLILLGLLQVGICVYKYGWISTGWNVLLDLAVLLVIGVAVGIYSFFRFKGKTQPIGLGDVVFIALLTPYFDYRTFLYFLIGSFTLTLIAWMLWCFFSKEKDRNIPLISGVATCYVCWLIYNTFLV